MSNFGAARDADARAFVTKARKDLAGEAVSTPPFLFMNAEGKVLGTAGPYDTPEKVQQDLLGVLKKNPNYNLWTKEEKELSAIDRAQVHIDLGQYEKARSLLKNEDSNQARYLMGRLARFDKDWKGMEKQFSKIDSPKLKEDLRMERAYQLWFAREFDKLSEHLKEFPKKSPRYSEAQYYQGLALYHKGDIKQAKTTWKSTIQSCSQDPWIYRADWAYSNLVDGNRRAFGIGGKRSSLLWLTTSWFQLPDTISGCNYTKRSQNAHRIRAVARREASMGTR